MKALVMDRTDTEGRVLCRAQQHGDSLNVLLYMFFDCETWADELRGRHELMLDILRPKDLGLNSHSNPDAAHW